MNSNVQYKLSIQRDVDYERRYVGQLSSEDRSVSLFRGTSIVRSDSEPEYFPPMVYVKATPTKPIEKRLKVRELSFANFESSSPDEVSEGEIETIVHDSKAVLIRDTDEDSYVKRVNVHNEYKYWMGVVIETGYKYELDFEKLRNRIEDAAEELGVADQLNSWINRELLAPIQQRGGDNG